MAPSSESSTAKFAQIAQKLAEANECLAALRVQRALSLYTDILKVEELHPVAFLNRSLCYLLLGFPHLAVTDAHRALLLTDLADKLDDHLGDMAIKPILTRVYRSEHRVTKDERDLRLVVGEGTLPFLDVPLADLEIETTYRTKEKAPPISTLKSTVLGRRAEPPAAPAFKKDEDLLLLDVRMKAYYRIALGLWQCGGGAWQSAMDVICHCEGLGYCTPGDRKQLMDLHNRILLEIECVLDEEEAEARKYMEMNNCRTPEMLTLHRDTGIRALLKSRFTKIRRQLYPWDEESLAWNQVLDERIADLNKGPVFPPTGLRFGLAHVEAPEDAPSICFITCKQFKAGKVVIRVRSSYNICGDSNIPYCNNCGAFLNADQTSHEQVPLRQHVEPTNLDRVRTPTYEKSSQSEGNELSTATDTTQQLSPSPPIASGPERLKRCRGCNIVAFCNRACYDKSIEFHRDLCGKSTANPLLGANPAYGWDSPSPVYTKLFEEMFRLVLFPNALENPLKKWAMVHGNLSNPTQLPSDLEIRNDTIPLPYSGSASKSIKELYPTRSNTHVLEKSEDPGKSDFTAPPARPRMMDWSYENNVVNTMNFLLGVYFEYPAKLALKIAYSVKYFDGWTLETLRAKLASIVWIQQFPTLEVEYDANENLIQEADIQQEAYDDPFAPALFEPGRKWKGSFHDIYALIPKARGDQKPNVKLCDRKRKIVAEALRDIEAGEVLLR